MSKHSHFPGRRMPVLDKHEKDAVVLYDAIITIVAKLGIYSGETLYHVRDMLTNLQGGETSKIDYDLQAAMIVACTKYIEEEEG